MKNELNKYSSNRRKNGNQEIGKILLVATILFGSSLLLTDCTPKITEEQKAKLQELYREETSLKNQISTVESENIKLRKELKARNAELKKCQDDKAFVEDKLKQWPNVWPDYDPNEGNEENAEEGGN